MKFFPDETFQMRHTCGWIGYAKTNSLFLSFSFVLRSPNAEFLLYQNAFHLKTKRINQKRAKNATCFASVQLECMCFCFQVFHNNLGSTVWTKRQHLIKTCNITQATAHQTSLGSYTNRKKIEPNDQKCCSVYARAFICL